MRSSPDYRRIFAGDRRKRAEPGGEGGQAARASALPAGRTGE
jgi:hypothetical protein